MNANPPTRILFVCLGNICRSPLAEGIFCSVVARRGLSGAFAVDSAGTGGWHAGSPPDPRSVAIAAQFGIDITGQRARRVSQLDFARFDLILGMDRSNVEDLLAAAPNGSDRNVNLFREYAEGIPADVPDPYYGGKEGFAEVYRMILAASEALAEKLERFSGAPSGHASSTT